MKSRYVGQAEQWEYVITRAPCDFPCPETGQRSFRRAATALEEFSYIGIGSHRINQCLTLRAREVPLGQTCEDLELDDRSHQALVLTH